MTADVATDQRRELRIGLLAWLTGEYLLGGGFLAAAGFSASLAWSGVVSFAGYLVACNAFVLWLYWSTYRVRLHKDFLEYGRISNRKRIPRTRISCVENRRTAVRTDGHSHVVIELEGGGVVRLMITELMTNAHRERWVETIHAWLED